MKDKPIAVGDLVQVVRGMRCCGKSSYLGYVYVVTRFYENPPAICNFCKTADNGDLIAMGLDNGKGVDLSMLKRIDPPATGEYDRVPVRKEIPA